MEGQNLPENNNEHLGLAATKNKSSLFDSRNKKFFAIFIALIALAGIYIIYRSFASTGVVMTGAEGEFTPVTPARVLDTRSGIGGLQPFAANAEQTLRLTANAGLPADNVSAAVINLTVVSPSSDGFMSVWPSDQPKPNTSSINFKAGKSITNQLTVKVGADGKIKMASSIGSLNVVIDVFGSYATADGAKGSRMNFITPTRALDTRNGTGGVTTALTNTQTVGVKIAGVGGVPSDAKAVTMTLTAVGPTANGFLTAYPSGITKPLVASLNYTTNSNIANQVTIPIGSDGKINLYNQGGATSAVLDITGYYNSPSIGKESSQQGRYYAINPERVYDSRTSGTQIAGGSTREISFTTKSPKPNFTSGVNINTAIVNPTASGFYRAWQASTPQPNASNMNYTAGSSISNSVLVATATNKITVSINTFINAGQADMVQDLYGYFAADGQLSYSPVGSINNWINNSGGTRMAVDITPMWGEDGYHYYSLQSFFKGLNYGLYAGIQTNGNLGDGKTVGNVYLFSIWEARSAKPENGAVATPFGGEGIGYSLRLRYDWEVGKTYTVLINRERYDISANEGAGGWIWSSSITDKSTGITTKIGEITSSATAAGLSGNSDFHERYIGSDPVCTEQSSNLEKAGAKFANLSSDVPIEFSGTSSTNNVFSNPSCQNYIQRYNTKTKAYTGFGVTKSEFDAKVNSLGGF